MPKAPPKKAVPLPRAVPPWKNPPPVVVATATPDPSPAEAWIVVYADALAALLCRLPLKVEAVTSADRARVMAEAATIADGSLELWRKRFAAA